MTLSTLETLRLTIAAIRQRTGESQRELATALGLTQDKVSRRQSGAQSWSLDEVDALARHWGMRPLDLLAGPTHAAQLLAWPPGTAAPHPDHPQPTPTTPTPTPTTAAPTTAAPTTAAPTTAAPTTAAPTTAAPTTAETGTLPAPGATTTLPPTAPVPPAATAPAASAVEHQDAAPAIPTATPAPAAPAAPIAPTAPGNPLPAAAPAVEHRITTPAPAEVGTDYDRGPRGEPAVHPAAPCERCGRPVSHRIAGRPLHLGGWCTPTAAPAAPQQPALDTTRTAGTGTGPVPPAPPAAAAAPAPPPPTTAAPRPAARPATATAAAPAPPPPTAAAPRPAARPAARPATATAAAPRSAAASRSEYAGTGRDLGYYLDMITSAVEQALEEHDGDTEAASAALEKKAIPNGMALFEATRVGAAYEHTVYPDRLEFLSKKTRNGADEIWEGRHKWENAPLMAALRSGAQDPVAVDVLDTNAAYCSALKTHLPIGSLVHQPDGGFDPKRSGIYLLPARPAWEHPHLPDPVGNRHEAGPVLLDGATVRLLIRCHKLGLTDAPHITEAWTSGASEGLLEKFRRVLTQARENAITGGDPVTEKYVKAMYAKFASTIGESTYNRDIRRPDWMHIIRSQAFANLWYKAHRAHNGGLTIVRLRGTDELHVTGGEWRKAGGGVFEEGRLTTQLKLKDQYTLPLNRKRSA
ncbi:helix-turn-helix domain-containing protein [Kitasatospora griseola]|uniref:helix-turn-helix domain-containing protein n=1 Tax=Kitasatospora griseola TaxID=2064 RepID=UPI00365D19AF